MADTPPQLVRQMTDFKFNYAYDVLNELRKKDITITLGNGRHIFSSQLTHFPVAYHGGAPCTIHWVDVEHVPFSGKGMHNEIYDPQSQLHEEILQLLDWWTGGLMD